MVDSIYRTIIIRASHKNYREKYSKKSNRVFTGENPFDRAIKKCEKCKIHIGV